MFTLENVKEFLKDLGYEWNYGYLIKFNTVIMAKTADEITSQYLSKIFIVEQNNEKIELKVSLNDYKFVIYKKEQNAVFANEKEENYSSNWQKFLKNKNLGMEK